MGMVQNIYIEMLHRLGLKPNPEPPSLSGHPTPTVMGGECFFGPLNAPARGAASKQTKQKHTEQNKQKKRNKRKRNKKVPDLKGGQASEQASKQASRQAGKQAGKQTSRLGQGDQKVRTSHSKRSVLEAKETKK